KAEELWIGAAAFSVSLLWLMFIGRTFNNYYLVWPMTGAVVAALMAVGSAPGPSHNVSPEMRDPGVARQGRGEPR
ncbi:MAG: hypothetical protein ABW228_08705, partial [Thermoleophilaceae bacterium]